MAIGLAAEAESSVWLRLPGVRRVPPETHPPEEAVDLLEVRALDLSGSAPYEPHHGASVRHDGAIPLIPTSLTRFHSELAAHRGRLLPGLGLDAGAEPDLTRADTTTCSDIACMMRCWAAGSASANTPSTSASNSAVLREVRLGASVACASAFSRSSRSHHRLPRYYIPVDLKAAGGVLALDSLVVQQVGGTGEPASRLLDHIRHLGRLNGPTLRAIGSDLAAEGRQRSEIRILDALVWASHPAASLEFELGQWERRVAPSPLYGDPAD
jgi:hypothetical protein